MISLPASLRSVRRFTPLWLIVVVSVHLLMSPPRAAAQPTSGTIELDVNTVTGDVKLVGNGIDMASYDIMSASGAMNSARWDSLSSQVLGDFLVFTTSDSELNEGSLDTNTVNFTGLQSYDIAQGASGLFRSGAAQDLTFTYLDASNDFSTGNVVYLPAVGSVPEPATAILLLPAWLLLRRRRVSRHA